MGVCTGVRHIFARVYSLLPPASTVSHDCSSILWPGGCLTIELTSSRTRRVLFGWTDVKLLLFKSLHQKFKKELFSTRKNRSFISSLLENRHIFKVHAENLILAVIDNA